MEIGDRIKQLRKEKGVTQEELAKATGLSRVTLGFYERNVNSMPLDACSAIAKYFGVSELYLMGMSGARKLENASVVDEIGLSESAVSAIKELASKNALGDMPRRILSDTRTCLDILNQLLVLDEFNGFLTSLAILSNPEAEELRGIEWSKQGEIKVPLSYIAKDLANKLVDGMAQGLKKVYAEQLQNTKGNIIE